MCDSNKNTIRLLEGNKGIKSFHSKEWQTYKFSLQSECNITQMGSENLGKLSTWDSVLI